MINAIVNQIDETFAALADPTRRQVVELLQREPLRASDIADRSGTSRAAMSRHLGVLRRAGLVRVETPDDDARARIYRLDPAHLVALRAWLDQVQAYWSDQLDSFRDHAERTRARPAG
jgi:DNA-binding transcriptional ArsR family regulator